MADMYGAVRSNNFKVKDVEAFKVWFNDNCYFGSEIELWCDSDGTCAFGGYEQYPSAYPRMPRSEDTPDEEICEWELGAFADAFRTHFFDNNQALEVVSAGNEKLRYVAAQRLRVGAAFEDFQDWYAGN